MVTRSIRIILKFKSQGTGWDSMLTIDQLLSVIDIATGIQHHAWRIGSNSHLYGTIRQGAEQIRRVGRVI